MPTSEPIGVGIVGLGFMGMTHLAAYERAARDGWPCRVVAAADPNVGKRLRQDEARGNIAVEGPGASDVREYRSAGELLSDPDVKLVSICTPTDTHVKLATAALEAGKHVLCEKPVALRADDIRELKRVAQRSNRVCMPAMCMRFWPQWKWLKDRIDDGMLGAVRSAQFHRVGAAPTWSQEFYSDPTRSGGALVDLHVHDADFVRFCFGDPTGVSSAGSIDHVTTTYRFDRGNEPPLDVVAEGGWLTRGTPFQMRYVVEFERATADFDLSLQPQLLLRRDGREEAVATNDDVMNGYDMEIRYVVRCAAEGLTDTSPNLDDAIAVAELLDAERASLSSERSR